MVVSAVRLCLPPNPTKNATEIPELQTYQLKIAKCYLPEERKESRVLLRCGWLYPAAVALARRTHVANIPQFHIVPGATVLSKEKTCSHYPAISYIVL